MMLKYGGFWLEGKQGNNAFAREKRQKSDLKLRVPSLIKGELKDLAIGKESVFCEENQEWNVQYFCGLQHFLFFEKNGVPIYLFDNHNHALAFWYEEWRKWSFEKWIQVVHIDQHSDMNENSFLIGWESELEIADFVNKKCNVGNFILPALEVGLIGEVVQVRSEWKLLNMQVLEEDYILDIDLDFWAPEMAIDQVDSTFEKIKKLMKSAKMITIATSPYFLEQELVLNLVRRIFGE